MAIKRRTAFTLVDLLKNFISSRERFCFILGAGISVNSGIPSGETLSKLWLEEYLANEPDESKKLIDEFNIDINNTGEFYCEIYKNRFSTEPKEGYLYLQRVMDSATPSCGFYHLAKILTETDSNFVITTNFDSLIEDSIFTFTSKRPRTIIHENLAQYINVNSNLPVITKIHRDLLFDPMSTPEECMEISSELKNALKKALTNYTLVVIGYGGNDGSLMKFLKDEIADETKSLYWCYYAPNGEPTSKIQNVLDKFDTTLIPIDGFDEMMVLIGQKFGHGKADKIIEHTARTRIELYNNQFDKINEELKNKEVLTETEKATSKAIGTIYEEEISRLSEAIKLNSSARNYFQRGQTYHYMGRYAEAIEDFDSALEIEPKNPDFLHARSYSYVLNENLTQALEDINNALEIDVSNGSYYGRRAFILSLLKKDDRDDIKKAEAHGLIDGSNE